MAAKKDPVVTLVQVYKDEAGEYRWRGLAANNKVISESGEGYNNRMYAKKMARALNASAVVQFV
jgi:uncharacterized protein YegP (UPF0339 family)